MYKTFEDLERVIALGKPDKVIDHFLERYLQGGEKEAWEAEQKAKWETEYPSLVPNPSYVVDGGEAEFIVNIDYIRFDGYMAHTEVIQEAVEAVYDGDGLLLTPEVKELTQLVREFTEVDVTTKCATWKTNNATMLRKGAYADLGDQFDEVTKALKYMSENGVDIGPNGIAQVAMSDNIKARFPR